MQQHTSQRQPSDLTDRDRVVTRIYETVLRPELYNSFSEAWADHVLAALEALSSMQETEARSGRLTNDPDLAAHFRRAFEILEQMGRNMDA